MAAAAASDAVIVLDDDDEDTVFWGGDDARWRAGEKRQRSGASDSEGFKGMVAAVATASSSARSHTKRARVECCDAVVVLDDDTLSPQQSKLPTCTPTQFTISSPTPAAAAASVPVVNGDIVAGPVSPLQQHASSVIATFPDAQRTWVEDRLREYATHSSFETATAMLCNSMLEKNDYPRLSKPKRQQPAQPSAASSSAKNFFDDYKTPVTSLQSEVATSLLANEHRRINMNSIRQVVNKFNGHYAPAFKFLREGAKNLPPQTGGRIEHEGITLVLLKGLRPARFVRADMLVQNEVEFVKEYQRIERQEQDQKMAEQLNEQEYEAAGQLIECGCCFGETAFEKMVQCDEGHLFCSDCVNSYVKEAAFGSSKSDLPCMDSGGCEGTFVPAELRKSLPAELYEKYEARKLEESLALANVEGLERCPALGCNYAMIIENQADKVFRCPACERNTCRNCKEAWDDDHFGVRCEDLETKDESKLRTNIEERMTLALKRSCNECGTAFYKSEGCNKMTCRCGALQCYICRVSITKKVGYKHFCQHPRQPNQKCTKCTKCSLWSTPDEDKKAVELERQRAEEEAKCKSQGVDIEAKRPIGPPKEAATKKAKKQGNRQPPGVGPALAMGLGALQGQVQAAMQRLL